MSEDKKINIKEFAAVEMKVGTITEVVAVPNTDKLLKLQVDFGDDTRQIVSGIADRVSPDYLIGKQCPFVTNLEPRTIRGVESNGMIMAVGTDNSFSLLHPHQSVENGATIR